MPTNEEYFQRWEESAPTPVQGTLTEEEILKHQGTRLKSKPTWESYDDELTPEEDPELLQAMAEYASRVSDAAPSSETMDELARLKEGSENQAKEYRWVSPEEYKNEGERVGQIMHSSTFITKLRESGLKCWYVTHPLAGRVTLIIQLGALPPEMGCWCMLGFAPELSVMRFDEHGIPLDEKYRGWRTCLLQLILKGAISQEKAEEVFGKPPVTRAFARYNATLRSFRNQGNRLDK